MGPEPVWFSGTLRQMSLSDLRVNRMGKQRTDEEVRQALKDVGCGFNLDVEIGKIRSA